MEAHRNRFFVCVFMWAHLYYCKCNFSQKKKFLVKNLCAKIKPDNHTMQWMDGCDKYTYERKRNTLKLDQFFRV